MRRYLVRHDGKEIAALPSLAAHAAGPDRPAGGGGGRAGGILRPLRPLRRGEDFPVMHGARPGPFLRPFGAARGGLVQFLLFPVNNYYCQQYPQRMLYSYPHGKKKKKPWPSACPMP